MKRFLCLRRGEVNMTKGKELGFLSWALLCGPAHFDGIINLVSFFDTLEINNLVSFSN